jgi:type IV pilus assembly protein PilF
MRGDFFGCLLVLAILPFFGCVTAQRTAEFATPTGETSKQYRARLATQLGAGYFRNGQYAVALEELNSAIAVDPNYGPAYGVLGLVYMELREDILAERTFQKGIEIAPQDPEVRNNYGWFLCQRGREKLAIEQFDTAIRNPLYSTPAIALTNAGNCSARSGDFKVAELYYQQALRASPQWYPALFGLTELSYRNSRFDDARAYMKSINQTATPSAAALLLGVCVEKRLNDRAGESSYLVQLRRLYPEAEETRKAAAGLCP